MLPSSLWQKELADIASNRKALFIKLAFPLTLGGAYLLAAPPGFYTATVITLMAAMIGCFGTGITLSRARSEGMLQRIGVAPLSPRRIVVEQLGINSAVDICQILPLLPVLAIRFGVYDARIAVFLFALAAAITAANLVGVLMSLIGSTPGEVMLYSSLALFPLLYLGGVFSADTPGPGLRWAISTAVPFSYLQQSLLAIIGEGTSRPLMELAEVSAIATAATGLVAALIAPRVVRFES